MNIAKVVFLSNMDGGKKMEIVKAIIMADAIKAGIVLGVCALILAGLGIYCLYLKAVGRWKK